MKKLAILFLLVAMLLPGWAIAKEKKIFSDPCIMAYTDQMGRIIKVIRSNTLIIEVKD